MENASKEIEGTNQMETVELKNIIIERKNSGWTHSMLELADDRSGESEFGLGPEFI